MSDLPKRSDDIYKEIESFADYELTQCVAYEMAVRNNEVVKLYESLDLFTEYTHTDKQAMVDSIVDTVLPDYDGSKQVKLLGTYGIDTVNVTFYNIEKMLCKNKNFKRGSAIVYRPENTKITNILNKDELDIVCTNEINSYNNESWVSDERKIYTKDDFLSFGNCLEYPFCEESDLIIKKALKRKQIINIENKFSRPKLEVEFTSIVNVEINMALPTEEIIAYIKKLKDEYNIYEADVDEDSKKIIMHPKTPLDLYACSTYKSEYDENTKGMIFKQITREFQQSGKPPKKKSERWADMFFIYDYVKARQNYIQKQNKSNEAELEAEIENIKKYHIGIDRKKRVAFAKAEYLENIINTKITDIFKEDELTKILELKADNISKLYYAIKPYIDDLKYKELITGVSTI